MPTPSAAARSCIHRLAPFLLVGLAVLTARAQETAPGDGADLAFGSAGSGPGQFLELRDIAFSPTGDLYALDGARENKKTKRWEGNLRVQKFDRAGKLLATIDLSDAATGQKLGDANDPQRLAVDSAGNVFVTQPAAGRVQQFGPDGKYVRAFDIPAATAITRWTNPLTNTERIAVIANVRPAPKGKPEVKGGADRIHVLNANGTMGEPVTLSKPVLGATYVATDRKGNLYVKGEPNAVYQFAPDGKLLRTLGGNPTTRAEDGSELLHTVAVDSKGNVYAITFGNPGLLARFNADGQSIALRGGQWKFADPWSVHSSYVAFAIDPQDRLWVAVTNRHATPAVPAPPDPAAVTSKKYHATPAILRTKADFFDENTSKLRTIPTRMPGFRTSLACGLPYNVSYDPGKPVQMEYVVAAANRTVDKVTVTWQAYDALKRPAGEGKFDVALTNGQESRTPFSFIPPKFGQYTVIARADSPKGEMGGVALHVAVTDRYPFSPELAAGSSKGGWQDVPRQIFTGLPQLRIHPGKDEKGLAKTDEELAAAEKAKVTFIVQIVDNMKHLTPEFVRAVVTRYKGRVPYYEICNEPGFSSKVDEYFAAHSMAYKLIKEIDPAAKVMGPATVNMDLPWFTRLYELGLKDVTDAISLHDYEGHESITPEHWRWKLAEIRKIMARYGDERKDIWQTERATSGVRGSNYQGLVQAVRVALHRDLLESLNIPADHNHHYYLNQGGYSGVPTYLWSSTGPHPGAVVLRVRHALTAALNRSYAGPLDFGPTGNTFLQGLRFAAKDGATTVILRNLGTSAYPVEFTTNAPELAITDAWGNASKLTPTAGKVRIPLEQLPTYVSLAANQDLTATRLNFGPNLAAGAKFEYSAPIEKGDPSIPPPVSTNPAAPPPPPAPPVDPNAPHPLVNGVYETYHNQNPTGDTNGQKIWTGALPLDDAGKPTTQFLTATFPEPRTFDKLIIRTVRADNTFCTLLAYDLQIPDGDTWRTILSYDHPVPPSDSARSADAKSVIWMDDTNLHVHHLTTPVTTTKLRLVAKRTTWGFVPDAVGAFWSKPIPPKLMLREIELYAPK
ncbi:MAG: hypothetical protein ACAI43_19940 [Phycisphaerae bacterium]|nr:NHL repeat-containing protein [Tepidisphaeraceae bacterium]